jgi:hypothetical protein
MNQFSDATCVPKGSPRRGHCYYSLLTFPCEGRQAKIVNNF